MTSAAETTTTKKSKEGFSYLENHLLTPRKFESVDGGPIVIDFAINTVKNTDIDISLRRQCHVLLQALEIFSYYTNISFYETPYDASSTPCSTLVSQNCQMAYSDNGKSSNNQLLITFGHESNADYPTGNRGKQSSKVTLNTRKYFDRFTAIEPSKFEKDLYLHAVHGIGYTLGMQISTNLSSIMHEFLDYRPELDNNLEDIRAVFSDEDITNLRKLYNRNTFKKKRFCFEPIKDSRIVIEKESLLRKLLSIEPLYIILIGIIVLMILFILFSLIKQYCAKRRKSDNTAGSIVQ